MQRDRPVSSTANFARREREQRELKGKNRDRHEGEQKEKKAEEGERRESMYGCACVLVACRQMISPTVTRRFVHAAAVREPRCGGGEEDSFLSACRLSSSFHLYTDEATRVKTLPLSCTDRDTSAFNPPGFSDMHAYERKD